MGREGAIRLTGGALRGRRILCAQGAPSRPTQGRIREAVFSILGDRIPGSRIVDVFSGTGAIALEAVSRGAILATCIEADPRAAQALEENARRCGVSGTVRVVVRDAAAALEGIAPGSADVVFADPPYGAAWPGHEAWRAVERILAGGGLFVLETRRGTIRTEPPEAMEPVKTRAYGDTEILIWRKARSGDG